MRKYESNDYIIHYTDNDEEYINDIINFLEQKSGKIMNFFELDKLSSKVKIIIWGSIEEYKNNISPYLKKQGREYKEWMIGDTMDGNINMLTISAVKTTKNRQNHSVNDLLGTLCHEFVHICHRQIRKNNNTEILSKNAWFSELLATNLGNPHSFRLTKFNATIEELENNFDNTPASYSIAYTIGQYLFQNYDKNFILLLSKDNDKLAEYSPKIFKEAKKWIENKTKQL
jgi:hypothetical protein